MDFYTSLFGGTMVQTDRGLWGRAIMRARDTFQLLLYRCKSLHLKLTIHSLIQNIQLVHYNCVCLIFPDIFIFLSIPAWTSLDCLAII